MPQSKSSELRWRKTDESIDLAYCLDHIQQRLYYARSYTVGQGYDCSQTNQLILNLKMSPNVSAQRLRYKQQAIRQFAQEVAIDLLGEHLPPDRSLTLVPIPPSKDRSHPDYDDRMEQVAAAIAAEFQNVEWLPLLSTTQSIEGYHSRSGGRNPEELYQVLQVDSTVAGRYQQGSTIALLDDVLTSGAHYTAARQRLLEVFPDVSMVGIFWAKAVSADGFLQ